MPPALILGGPYDTTLQAIWCLAQDGIPHFTVGTGKSYVSYSRWHRRLVNDFNSDPTPESLVEFLEHCPIEQMVLLPCSDEWVAAVSGLKPVLAERFPASIAPPESIDICLDKGRCAETMSRLGLPHPRTILISPNDDIRTLWSRLRNPFIKARNTKAFMKRYGTTGFLVRTPEEAMKWIHEARAVRLEVMLQEYIPGAVDTHYMVEGFVDRSGTFCARLARRWVRASDERFTLPSCSVNIPLEKVREPLNTLDRLLPALRYRGVFSAQFKWDERDGLFKLFDFNPRIWGGVRFPLSFGVNVATMAYRDALGLAVDPLPEYPYRKYFINGKRDVNAYRRPFRASRFNLGAWLHTHLDAVYFCFRWNDPLPAVVSLFSEVWHRFHRNWNLKGSGVVRKALPNSLGTRRRTENL